MGEMETSVLVVDDEVALADLYATWLETDYEVRVAYDGDAALEQFDASVDVVLLDRRMPGPSGEEVLAAIREQNAATQVVMVTAVEPEFDIIGLTFDGYLMKPVSKDNLLDLVEGMAAITEYDERIREFCRVAATKAVLDAKNPLANLEASEEYQQLVAQFQTLKAAVEDAEGVSVREEMVNSVEGRLVQWPPVEVTADTFQ